GMLKNGYSPEFAEQIFKQIEGFGEYGFPESHAASFALLVYVSSWLKRHEPACFLAALLNSQPLGFYSPSQLVQDAQRHGALVRPVDVTRSDWDCTLEPEKPIKLLGEGSSPAAELLGSDPNSGQISPQNTRPSTDLGSDPNSGSTKTPRSGATQSRDVCRSPAVRLGLRQVSGLSEAAAQRIVSARLAAPFSSTEDLALRCALDVGDLKALASADALKSLSGHRRQQVWDAAAQQSAPGLLRAVPVAEDALLLPAASEGEEVIFDYAALGLTLRRHPLSLLREQLSKMRLLTAAQLRDLPNGRLVRACGIVTMRQQPQTAKGVVFVTLEDETGQVNVIVWKSLKERQRPALLRARLLAVHGTWQRDVESGGDACHLIAGHLQDLTPLLGGLTTQSREFC
ncbi:MAG TPA: OB-fold nucleic acid binding domain-containing protein, partial [Rhodoferax sp.]